MKNKKYIYLCLVGVLLCIITVSLVIFLPQFILSQENGTGAGKLEIICQKPSPYSSYTAIMFSVKGEEGSTPFQLSIVPQGETVNEKDTANAFSYDGIYDVEWQDESTLLVKLYEDKNEYYKVEEIGGIKLRYLSPEETREYEKNKKTTVST